VLDVATQDFSVAGCTSILRVVVSKPGSVEKSEEKRSKFANRRPWKCGSAVSAGIGFHSFHGFYAIKMALDLMQPKSGLGPRGRQQDCACIAAILAGDIKSEMHKIFVCALGSYRTLAWC